MKAILAAIAAVTVSGLTAAAQPPAAPSAPPAVRLPATPQPALRSDWKQTKYDAHGPLATQTFEGGPACTIFRPVDLKPGTPVILWGNGTTQRPINYAPLLDHLASYGFVVAAANTTNAGTGVDMLACLDWLTAENSRDRSAYQGKLDLTRVGASGHSQGGGGTIMAGRDPRIKATAPVMPYTAGLGYVMGAEGKQHAPMLMLSGDLDNIAAPARNQQVVYDKTNAPIHWLTLKGAGHLAPMQGSAVYRGAVTAWFLYQLNGDAEAGKMFEGVRCGYCRSKDWTIVSKTEK